MRAEDTSSLRREVAPGEEAAASPPDAARESEDGEEASTAQDQRTCGPGHSYPPQKFTGDPAGKGILLALAADRSSTTAPVNRRNPPAIGEPHNDATPRVLRPNLAGLVTVHRSHPPPTNSGVQRENGRVYCAVCGCCVCSHAYSLASTNRIAPQLGRLSQVADTSAQGVAQ
jgi:hypothetical protein